MRDPELRCFSAPGRVELGGNHTDHSNGLVLAAATHLNTRCRAKKREDKLVRIMSKDYGTIQTALDDLSCAPEERETPGSLVKGILCGFADSGYHIGGFDAWSQSDIMGGSGLSSSGSFEILICSILNGLYNNNRISPLNLAHIAHFAETAYFGKPSGMMDQLVIAEGGILFVDFRDNTSPMVSHPGFNFEEEGYCLCTVATGGNHRDLTCHYAEIQREMQSVASFFEKETLRQVSYEDILNNTASLRTRHGDRALLRSLHFMEENRRVKEQFSALSQCRFADFLSLVIESGQSSFQYLQNVFSPGETRRQELALALFLAEKMLKDCGAWRVHGGGFAGTTLNIVPLEKISYFIKTMEQTFGEGCCTVLRISKSGGSELTERGDKNEYEKCFLGS